MGYITNLPVNGTFNVTAYFGQQNKKYWANGHKGIDITAADRNLYAICDGKVTAVGYDADGWGALRFCNAQRIRAYQIYPLPHGRRFD